jgi:rhodanese-related sulfurtransferase
MNKKIIVSMFVIGLMLVSSGASLTALSENKQAIGITDSTPQNLNKNIINITVQEAYGKLTNTGDGIQIPIDVRWIHEWRPQRIDTPIPEHPRWYVWDLIKNASILPKFLNQYDGCEVIIYCKAGGRSWDAATRIFNAGFNGVIYNMVGGITEWNIAGLPTARGGIYNITVNETMLLLSNPLNGIQTPVDVRRWNEWITGFIDTPWPECPIW